MGVFSPKWSLRFRKGMFVGVPTVLAVVFLKGRWPLYRHGADPPQKISYRHADCGSPCLSLLWPFSSSQYFFKGCFFPRARSKVDPRMW